MSVLQGRRWINSILCILVSGMYDGVSVFSSLLFLFLYGQVRQGSTGKSCKMKILRGREWINLMLQMKGERMEEEKKNKRRYKTSLKREGKRRDKIRWSEERKWMDYSSSVECDIDSYFFYFSFNVNRIWDNKYTNSQCYIYITHSGRKPRVYRSPSQCIDKNKLITTFRAQVNSIKVSHPYQYAGKVCGVHKFVQVDGN